MLQTSCRFSRYRADSPPAHITGMSTPDRSRHPAGRPTGGQFVTEARLDSGLAFEAYPTQTKPSDTDLMNQLAQMLGADDEWTGSADYLDDAANIVAASGRPHPGDHDYPQGYARDLAAWERDNPPPADPLQRRDYQCLSRIAVELGGREWGGADQLDPQALGPRAGHIQATARGLSTSWLCSAGISITAHLDTTGLVRGRPSAVLTCR